jgi:hypothetical protein
MKLFLMINFSLNYLLAVDTLDVCLLPLLSLLQFFRRLLFDAYSNEKQIHQRICASVFCLPRENPVNTAFQNGKKRLCRI